MNTCGICREVRLCTEVKLTPMEQKTLLQENPDTVVEESYYYCRPCFRVIEDPQQGPQLMRSLFVRRLKRDGVDGLEAEAFGDLYKTRLIELQRKVKHGTKA